MSGLTSNVIEAKPPVKNWPNIKCYWQVRRLGFGLTSNVNAWPILNVIEWPNIHVNGWPNLHVITWPIYNVILHIFCYSCGNGKKIAELGATIDSIQQQINQDNDTIFQNNETIATLEKAKKRNTRKLTAMTTPAIH